MKLHIIEYKGFLDSLVNLERRGGKFQKAAQKIWEIHGKSNQVNDPFHGVQPTKNGENRIKNCIKYDLTGFARLITVFYGNTHVLLYCGTHEECDKWLDKNQGMEFAVEDKKVIPLRQEIIPRQGPQTTRARFAGPLIERLPEEMANDLLDGLGLVAVKIHQLSNGSSQEEIARTLEKVEAEKQRAALSDVLILLSEDQRDLAVNRAKLYQGLLEEAANEFEKLQIPDIVDSEYVRTISASHPQYPEILRQFAASADYKSWMTFLHPDQQELVERDFRGSARILGVSGSGKTCVVVRRAVHLAEQQEQAQVLILTLNEPLSELISSLVDVCAPQAIRPRIVVQPFYQLCTDLLKERFPHQENAFRITTWKSEEHVDEIWMEYYRCENNNQDASVLFPVHDALQAQGIRAEQYIREEFDWIRSALPREDRASYLTIERTGRSVPLQKEQRELILRGLEGWERKMEAVGAMDVLGIAQRLHQLKSDLLPRFTSIIIDECQDFGTVELSIIRQLVPNGSNDVLLVGDAAQRVSTRRQSLRAAGIDLPPARSERLRKNYRNSKEILKAASTMFSNNFDEEYVTDEDFDVIDPEFSAFEGGFPAILRANSLKEELVYALSYCADYTSQNPGAKVCLALAGFSLWEVRKWALEHGLRVLDGETSLGEDRLFVSDLEQTKGFEFDAVCIVNCSEGALPEPSLPAREWVKALSRLYVAMTRARLELCVSFSGAPSPFLSNLEEVMPIYDWSEYADPLEGVAPNPPERVDEFRDNGDTPQEVYYQTGMQVLYGDAALGVSVELAEKLRALIDGTGRTRVSNGRSRAVSWKNLQEATKAVQRDAYVRNLWGPKTLQEFRELTEKLGVS